MLNRRGRTWLAALAVPLALLASACGSSDSAGTSAGGSGGGSGGDLAKVSGTLNGQGSSFQDTFEQAVAAGFGKAVKTDGGQATVTYTKTGSSDGKKALADQTVGFAGSDSAIKDEEKAAFGSRQILYFPIVGGPIAVAYKLNGVEKLNLGPDVIANIFQAQIISWDDAAIKADNPGVTLPSEPITVVHRSDGSGTTKNFTKWLTEAAPDTWKLDSGEEVNWDPKTQGAEKSTGVTSVVKSTEGAIGYADLADAAKESLSVAAVGNPSGDFVAPTPDSASAALDAAEIAADLTYDPLNADAAGAYPITSPTWILVDAKQADQATADLLKAYLNYVLTTGQGQAKQLLYAPLPKSLADQAIAQIDKITVG